MLIVNPLITAMLAVFVAGGLFKGLIYSQILLSMQQPFTIILQIYLVSPER